MPAYAVAMINVTDPVRYQEYMKRSGPAIARYGGRFVARGGVAETLEGGIPWTRMVIVEFPGVADAKKFYDSPEYAEARRHRLGAADFNMVVIEGV